MPVGRDGERELTEPKDQAYGGASALAGKVFLWFVWALAAAFWAFTLSTAVGIVQVASDLPADGPGAGEIDVGGVGWILINFVGGLIILGLAIAWGAWRWSSRDKRIDPVTEAATRAEYDLVEAAGGDDAITRSPESRRPEERDAYRAARDAEAGATQR